MVRLGLGVCAVSFTVMLLIPVPMARVGVPVSPSPFMAATSRADGPIGAPADRPAWTSLAPDTRVEVPAPRLFTGLSDVSSFGVTTEAAPAPTIYRIAAPRAALRAGPAVGEREIGRLKIGERVEVLTIYDQSWLYVRLADGTTEGYVNETDLAPAN